MKHTRFRVNATDETLAGTLHSEHAQSERGQTFPLADVTLLVPVVPSKIVGVGHNYMAHAAELGNEVSDKPLLFLKPPSALNHPEAPIVLPDAPRIDYEGEIAVVIGKRCKDVSEADAAGFIWGYTGFNDITDRDAQSWEKSWVRGKAFDTSACLGPVIVTPDEMPDPISVTTRLNGEVKQQGDTSLMVFSIPFLICAISSILTLERGDVIATGTPAGVGPLTSGDVVEIEVSGVGVLRNPVA